MTPMRDYIQSLETFIEDRGARVMRTSLPECVHGRVVRNLISLRAGLAPEQEFVALVHELAHWLVHQDVHSSMTCTLFEYEAEAVEAMVMARLELPPAAVALCPLRVGKPTDGLLSASVTRVMLASTRICGALGVETQRLTSHSQTPVDLEAAAGEEIVFEYEQYGMGDFLGLPEAF